MGAKKLPSAKQPFMFHYGCFLLLCGLEYAPPVRSAWGTLGPVEAFRGLLGPVGVETGLTLGPFGVFGDFLWSACPKNRFWAVICMGTANPSDKRPLSAIEALAREKPAQLMAQLRAVWPQVQQALDAGHTLRLIHKRLNMVGIEISYKRLIVYRGRIERRKKGPAAPASPNTLLPTRSPDKTAPAFDPLANFRAQEQKRVSWQYPSGPSDESKLI
jgi:hypothetical protein